MSRSYTSARAAARGHQPTFTLDGATFTCHGTVSALDLSELARNADIDVATPEAMAIMAEFFHDALGAAEYKRFRRHCREHGTDAETLMEILAGIVEDVTARPTEPPSDSPDSPSANGPTSRVVSLQQGTVREMEVPFSGFTPERSATSSTSA